MHIHTASTARCDAFGPGERCYAKRRWTSSRSSTGLDSQLWNFNPGSIPSDCSRPKFPKRLCRLVRPPFFVYENMTNTLSFGYI